MLPGTGARMYPYFIAQFADSRIWRCFMCKDANIINAEFRSTTSFASQFVSIFQLRLLSADIQLEGVLMSMASGNTVAVFSDEIASLN